METLRPSAMAPGVRGSQSPSRGFAPAAPDTPYPCMAELRRRAEEDAARVMKPFNAIVLFAACAAIVLALPATLAALDRIDRDIAIEDRV